MFGIRGNLRVVGLRLIADAADGGALGDDALISRRGRQQRTRSNIQLPLVPKRG